MDSELTVEYEHEGKRLMCHYCGFKWRWKSFMDDFENFTCRICGYDESYFLEVANS